MPIVLSTITITTKGTKYPKINIIRALKPVETNLNVSLSILRYQPPKLINDLIKILHKLNDI